MSSFLAGTANALVMGAGLYAWQGLRAVLIVALVLALTGLVLAVRGR